MVEQLIDDVNRALDNEAYFAALTLALTLPDICGKAQYPESGGGKRYIDSLRNSMLHQGTPNINKEGIKNTAN